MGVPVTVLAPEASFSPSPANGPSRYAQFLRPGCPLEALLINRGSDVLLVGLHGATDRSKYLLPRFEWLRTMLGMSFNALLLSDPALHLSADLELSWYIGWKGLSLPLVVSDWVRIAASTLGVDKVVFFGSSGGGFAAMQVASHVPGSTAVAFNPQTRIDRYYSSAKGRFLNTVMGSADGKWPSDLDSQDPQFSLVARYASAQPCQTYFWQNRNDRHHVDNHYLPFRREIEGGPNKCAFRFIEYDGPARHSAPTQSLLVDAISQAIGSPEDCRDRRP
ncbi:hypothetical protein GCM10007967_26820 [Xylanimonas ulmi]|uniref:Pimeloyl-ACP methyl ester carboxylesterase n=1 Tax=Xylanimonas ulmi TaxID=228973 RepID=A0A4Q7M4V8_9MICO|nr:pimeloyl-ACP methyl ester carboxylesterase [Xylanibacterium ulmi]